MGADLAHLDPLCCKVASLPPFMTQTSAGTLPSYTHPGRWEGAVFTLHLEVVYPRELFRILLQGDVWSPLFIYSIIYSYPRGLLALYFLFGSTLQYCFIDFMVQIIPTLATGSIQSVPAVFRHIIVAF